MGASNGGVIRGYVVAGEVSGDVHGAELLGALGGGFEFRGLGGSLMRKVTEGSVVDWVDDSAVMGIWEVLKRYDWFRRKFTEVLDEIEEWRPEVLILVDYPGFNLRLAAAVKERWPEVKVVDYVAPQVWAWNRSRLPKMAKTLDLVLCLFSFEEPFLIEAGVPARWVGHPLVDELAEKRQASDRVSGLVGLFPGSREREVARLLPPMLEAARVLQEDRTKGGFQIEGLTFEVSAASDSLAKSIYAMVEQAGLEKVAVRIGESHRLMKVAEVGVLASGTATLEAALLGLPYCLIYQMATLTYAMAKRLVKIPHAGLVNILAGREVVRELIQEEANGQKIAEELARLLTDEAQRKKLQEELAEVVKVLGNGNVHERAAEEVRKLLGLPN